MHRNVSATSIVADRTPTPYRHTQASGRVQRKNHQIFHLKIPFVRYMLGIEVRGFHIGFRPIHRRHGEQVRGDWEAL